MYKKQEGLKSTLAKMQKNRSVATISFKIKKQPLIRGAACIKLYII